MKHFCTKVSIFALASIFGILGFANAEVCTQVFEKNSFSNESSNRNKKIFRYVLNGVEAQFPLHEREKLQLDEYKSISGTAGIFQEFFKKLYGTRAHTDPRSKLTYAPGQSRRGVHPEAHGTLHGTLIVNDHIQGKDQTGIFSYPGKKYPVVARFSNGSPRPFSTDQDADTRGFGLKVLEVEGEPILKDFPGINGGVQDFTMNSSDRFFADTPKTYERFMKIALLETNSFKAAATQHLKEVLFRDPILFARILRSFNGISSVKAENPLNLKYFSITPFKHGPGTNAPIVKYKLEPAEGNTYTPVDTSQPYFLRTALKETIKNQPIAFRFMIQYGDKNASVIFS